MELFWNHLANHAYGVHEKSEKKITEEVLEQSFDFRKIKEEAFLMEDETNQKPRREREREESKESRRKGRSPITA